MNLAALKTEALRFQGQNTTELSQRIADLRAQGVSLLGCLYFLQINQGLTLAEARQQFLESAASTAEDKNELAAQLGVMMADYKKDEE